MLATCTSHVINATLAVKVGKIQRIVQIQIINFYSLIGTTQAVLRPLQRPENLSNEDFRTSIKSVI